MYAMCCATVVAYASYCCPTVRPSIRAAYNASLPLAKRVLLIKADSSLLIFLRIRAPTSR